MSTPIANNPGAIFAAGPKATGGVLYAPLGTPLPALLSEEPDDAFVNCGLITEDGLSMTQDLSWEKIKDWNGDTVRRILSDFAGTFSWTFLETTERTANAVFGDANVTATAAALSHGNLLHILGNAKEAPSGVWLFQMIDGPRLSQIGVEIGQITDRGDVSYTKSGATTYPVTLEASPDPDGTSFHIWTDDGKHTTV